LTIYPEAAQQIYITQIGRILSLICVNPTVEPKHVKLKSIKWYKGWYHSENELYTGSLISSNGDSSVLKIDEMNYSNSLNYTCVATVRNYTKSSTISLYALEKPSIIEMPSDRLVSNKNQNIKFECKFEVPLPKGVHFELYSKINVNWYFLPEYSHDWKQIYHEKLTQINENQFVSQLYLKMVNERHFGYYKCEVKIDNFDTVCSKPAFLSLSCK
jgi:hypothetical protein